MSPSLHIETFCLGEWMTNCYVVWADGGDGAQPCWVVDAGFGPGDMIGFIRERGLALQQVVLTHAHVDHIAGLQEVRDAWPDVPILIHADEADFLTEPTLNLSAALAEPVVAPAATGTLAHGDVLELGGLNFQVRHTPGHSPGGISLYQAESGVVLVGDALFAGSVGRTDFPTSDGPTLGRAIREQLYTLPDDTRVLPGHGPATTIGREKRTNPYVRA
jgi:hydroxyacylglutathione hydrolase